MSNFATIGLSLILGLFSLVGVGVLFWLALRRPPVRRPSCGKCGYEVEGLETLSCPECGSDLREVGIETPTRRMMPAAMFILFWTALMIMPLLSAYALARRAGPEIITAQARYAIESNSGALPSIEVDQNMVGVAVGSRGFGRNMSADVVDEGGTRTATFTFTAIGTPRVESNSLALTPTPVAETDRVPKAMTLDSDRAAPARLDRAALVSTLVSAGADPKSPEFDADVTEVVALFDAMLAGETTFASTRLGPGGSSSLNISSRTPGWYTAMLLAIGAALYALGIVVYLVLRKRRLAASA